MILAEVRFLPALLGEQADQLKMFQVAVIECGKVESHHELMLEMRARARLSPVRRLLPEAA